MEGLRKGVIETVKLVRYGTLLIAEVTQEAIEQSGVTLKEQTDLSHHENILGSLICGQDKNIGIEAV